MSNYGIYFEGVSRSAQKTLIFEVQQGGCVSHWVSARNHVEALSIAAEHDCLDGHPAEDAISISVVSDEALRSSRFIDDNGAGETRSLWDEWQRDPSPRYVASSEW